MALTEFIRGLTVQIMTLAWFIFLVTWVLGWAIKGAPIPIHKIKRTGQSLVEDAIMAAFWMALGTSVFTLISYLVSQVYQPMPPPPQP